MTPLPNNLKVVEPDPIGPDPTLANLDVKGWIGVDLDGTLAYYDTWKGWTHIGAPIPAMVTRVRTWLENGIEVRIMTGRAAAPDPATFLQALDAIFTWCEQHIGKALPVTNKKDMRMIELWDDRAVQVGANTGKTIAELIDEAYQD